MTRRRVFPRGARVAVALENLDLLEAGPILASLERPPAQLVERDLLGQGDDIGVGELTQLLDLRVRKGGLGGAASAEQIHLPDAALAQGLERVVGDVGLLEFLGRPAEDPGHVDGDVAHADHGRPLLREVELAVAEFRMAVVPGHEFGGRVAPLQVLPGDAHAAVGLGAGGVEDLVIVLAQIVDGDVLSELDTAEEPEAR